MANVLKEREKERKKLNKALEKAANCTNARKLAGFIASSEYPEVHTKSIYALAHLAEKGDAKAAAALLDTAKTSASAADRCQAAILLPDKETAKQIVRDSIIEAYSQKNLGRSYSSATWIRYLDDKELMFKAYKTAAAHNSSLKSSLEATIDDHDLQKRIIIEQESCVGDFITTREVMKHFEGTRQDWVDIALKAKCQTAIADAIAKIDPLDRPVLEKLAAQGNKEAEKRLLALWPNEFRNKMWRHLPDLEIRRAIENDKMDQEALEDICDSFRPKKRQDGRWGLSLETASLALSKLKGRDVLIRLLRNDMKSEYFYDSDYETWLVSLIDRLKDEDELLTEFLSSNEVKGSHYSAEDQALKYINDEEQLLKIALSRRPRSFDAAVRIKGRNTEKLLHAPNSKVANYANRSWTEYCVMQGAPDDELMKIIRRALYDRDYDLAKKAIAKLNSIDSKYKLVEESCKDWHMDLAAEQVAGELTDGARLAEICLRSKNNIAAAAVKRLSELTKGTPAGDEFVEKMKQRLIYDSSSSYEASILGKYLGIDYRQAAWELGGPELISNLADKLEKAKEYEQADIIAKWLNQIYKYVPDSQSRIGRLAGRSYEKHVDYDAACASESEHRMTTYYVKIG